VTLWQDVSRLRSCIKHAPDQVDLEEVRMLLGEIEDALEVLDTLTNGAGVSAVFDTADEGWAITVSTVVEDRRPVLAWIGSDR